MFRCSALCLLSILYVSVSSFRFQLDRANIRGESQSSDLTSYHCGQQIEACHQHYPEALQEEKCNLRGQACLKGQEFFSPFDITHEPCAVGTWNVIGQATLPWTGTCGPNMRILKNVFVDPAKFDTDTARLALVAFIYQELSDVLSHIGCAMHATYDDVAKFYYKKSLEHRGVVDAVSLTNLLTMAVSAADPLTHLIHPLNPMAKLLLRHLWFNEVGAEIVGLRYKVVKNPRAHPMTGCHNPIYDSYELWEITRNVSFADATFPQYLPGVMHHVLECVEGSCKDKDGHPAPPVLVSLQGHPERVSRSALILAAKSAGLAYLDSEDAFEAFLSHAR